MLTLYTMHLSFSTWYASPHIASVALVEVWHTIHSQYEDRFICSPTHEDSFSLCVNFILFFLNKEILKYDFNGSNYHCCNLGADMLGVREIFTVVLLNILPKWDQPEPNLALQIYTPPP